MKDTINYTRKRIAALDHPQVIAAALASGSAYLAEMAVDMRLLHYPLNDIRMLGEMLGRRRSWPLVGTAAHYSFSIFLAYVYAAYARERLPGPAWMRGLIFINIENGVLYPFAPLLDRFNPTIQSGEMPPVFSITGFVNQLLRHAAFGVVLGSLLRRRKFLSD